MRRKMEKKNNKINVYVAIEEEKKYIVHEFFFD